VEAGDRSMKALVVVGEEGVAALQRMVALAEVEVAGQAMKWEEEVAVEEDHLLQAVVVPVSQHLVGEVEEREEQSFRSVLGLEVEVAAAFLQLQHSRLGRKNPLGEVVEDRPNVQAEEEVRKRCACPRKVEVH